MKHYYFTGETETGVVFHGVVSGEEGFPLCKVLEYERKTYGSVVITSWNEVSYNEYAKFNNLIKENRI